MFLSIAYKGSQDRLAFNWGSKLVHMFWWRNITTTSDSNSPDEAWQWFSGNLSYGLESKKGFSISTVHMQTELY